MKKSVAQAYRDRDKAHLVENLEEYRWLNSITNMYPPQDWSPTAFASPDDPPLVGDRKLKNKLSAKNSRERTKRRNKELEDRIMHLRKETDLQYMFYLPQLEIAAEVAHELFIHKICQKENAYGR